MSALAARIRQRAGRLRPGLLAVPMRIWLVGCIAVSLGLAAVILIPGLTDAVAAEGEGAIARFSAPLTFRLAVIVGVAALAGAAVVWAMLRARLAEHATRPDAVLREALLVTVALAPAFALAADREVIRAVIALGPAVTLLVLAHVPRVRASHAGIAALGVVAALPWLTLLEYQPTEAGSRPESWLWVSLFGVAAAFAAFGAYYGVARAAESRSANLGFLYRTDLRPLLVLGIVVLAAALVAARLTVGRELFAPPDPGLWSPFGRSAVSWALALLVAGMLVVVALRASRRPLTRFGERRIVAGLAGLGNLELFVSIVVILIGMVAATAGAELLPTEWIGGAPLFKFVGVVLLGLVVLLPAFRGTAARWIGLITAVFLIPRTLSVLLANAGVTVPAPFAGFEATPVQVLLLMLVAALGLAVWNLVRPGAAVNPSLVTRLAVVPLVAVHAGWLLPAAWSGLGRVIVVVGVLAALLWLMPPVAADGRRHAATVMGAATAQLLALVVFVLAIPSLFEEGSLVVLGLLWLAIPIIAALTIDTRESH